MVCLCVVCVCSVCGVCLFGCVCLDVCVCEVKVCLRVCVWCGLVRVVYVCGVFRFV